MSSRHVIKHIARQIIRWVPLVVLLCVPLAYILGEIHYARSIAPTGVLNVDDHLQRFGPPEFITNVHQGNNESDYYEFSGFPRGKIPRLAMPSSRPAYVYDAKGMLIDWCSDPGDNSSWRKKWYPVDDPDSNVDPLLEQLSQSLPSRILVP